MSEEQQQRKEEKKSFLSSDTIKVSLITVVGYCLIYVYTISYLKEFRIPIELVSLDLFSIFSAINFGFVFFYFLGLFLFILFSSKIANYFTNRRLLVILAAIPAVLQFTIPSFYIPPIEKFAKFRIPLIIFSMISFPLAMLFVQYLTFWLFGKRGKAPLPTIALLLSKVDFVDEIERKLLTTLVVFSWSLFLFMTFYAFGISKARTTVDYLVADTIPECAVLYYIKQDTIICSPFDRNTKELEPVFKFIKISESKDIEFRQESIGPLHPKPTPTPTAKPTKTPKPTATPKVTNTPVPTITASPTP